MPILYLSPDERRSENWKAPGVPFDAFEFQRRYRLKAMQAREDRLLVLWALVALATGVLLVAARSL
jgi:hypothetical protein